MNMSRRNQVRVLVSTPGFGTLELFIFLVESSNDELTEGPEPIRCNGTTKRKLSTDSSDSNLSRSQWVPDLTQSKIKQNGFHHDSKAVQRKSSHWFVIFDFPVHIYLFVSIKLECQGKSFYQSIYISTSHINVCFFSFFRFLTMINNPSLLYQWGENINIYQYIFFCSIWISLFSFSFFCTWILRWLLFFTPLLFC